MEEFDKSKFGLFRGHILVEYATGNLYKWSKMQKKWVQKKSTPQTGGYCTTWYADKMFQTSRIVIETYLGRELKQGEEVNHIDHDRTNNCVRNLEIVTRQQNVQYMRMRPNNKSGLKGVHFCNTWKKWRAQITVDGNKYSLGNHKTKEEAFDAWCKKACELNSIVDENGKPRYRFYIPSNKC